MIDVNQLTSLISAFSVETEKESISPETVGKQLQDITNLLAGASSDTERQVLDDWKAQLYGTGRETPRGNSGDLGRAKVRQRRKWSHL